MKGLAGRSRGREDGRRPRRAWWHLNDQREVARGGPVELALLETQACLPAVVEGGSDQGLRADPRAIGLLDLERHLFGGAPGGGRCQRGVALMLESSAPS